MIRVLLACPDPRTAAEVAALAAEAGTFGVERTVPDAPALLAALEVVVPDVVLLHHEVGPLPVLELARELVLRAPDAAPVLLAEDVDAALLSAALRAGFRGVARLPLSLEDLAEAITAAGALAQSVRARQPTEGEGVIGAVLAVAGAKGGVGTTTVAVHLALEAVRADADRRVCLVDLDLQAGDVRGYLDLHARRSIADLVEVADDLTSRHLDEALALHPSGLRVLLPPLEGEQGEDVTGEVARRVLGALRARFSLVVVDVGAVVTEGGSVATELADRVLLVTTPDVPAMRGANRLLHLWERLRVRKDHVAVVVNRASRDSEIQPELVGRIVDAPPLRTAIPSDFRSVESAANTGVPDRLAAGPVADGIARLAAELRLAPRPRGRGLLPFRSDAGQVAVDALGTSFVLALVVLVLWELVLAGFTFVLGQHAAREAARVLAVTSLRDDALVAELEHVAAEDLPGGWTPSLDLELLDEDRLRVSLAVPLLVPGFVDTPIRIDVEEGTLRERGRGSPVDAAPSPSPSASPSASASPREVRP